MWDSAEHAELPGSTGRVQCCKPGRIAAIDAQTVLLGMQLRQSRVAVADARADRRSPARTVRAPASPTKTVTAERV